jgi:hypothetical protein
VGIGAGLDRCGKSRPHPDSIPGLAHTDFQLKNLKAKEKLRDLSVYEKITLDWIRVFLGFI